MACALASRPHSKFISGQSVRRLLQTNGASGSRLTSSTIPIHFRIFRTMPTHMLRQNWQKLHLTRPQLKASLPPKDLCNLCRGYCNVNFGMVDACLPLLAETRNCGAHRIKLKSRDWKSSLDISLFESEAAWDKNQHKAENLHSVHTLFLRAYWSSAMWAEQTKSWRVSEPWECKVEKWRWATERWFRDTYILPSQTFWFSRSVWRKQ